MHQARRAASRRIAHAALLMALALLMAAGPAASKTAPAPAAGKRVIEQTPHPRAPIHLRETEGAWQVARDEDGVVRRLTRLAGGDQEVDGPAADAETVARTFLMSRSEAMRLAPDLSDLRLVDVIESPGGNHVRFQQEYEGVPIEAGVVWVTVGRGGEVMRVANESLAGMDLDVRPAVTADDAVRSVREAIGAAGTLHAPERADLVIRRYEGRVYLAWKTIVPADDPFGDWEAFVDARTGRIEEIRDRVLHYTEGSGQIWDPNPPVRLMNNSISDLNDADQTVFNAAYQTGLLHELNDAVGGVYRLRGRFVSSIEFESPVVTLATNASPTGFVYTRSDDRFEEVICYYHIDTTQRHIQSLGFTNVNNRVQEFDAHGLSGDDNSHYIPSTKRIAYGDGCVDDSEDADVVIHEYGHSIQDNQVPGFGASAEGGAMGEGFGDYIASSMASDVNPSFQPYVVFDWDKGPVDNCWPGRRLDSTKHYPEDLVGQVHSDGEIWSAVLWQIANDIGFSVTDAVILESQFDIPTTGTMVDGAEAMVVADQNLFGGAHVSSIVYWMDLRGILDASNYIPSIVHTPLGDTEDTVGPYVVTAVITPGAAPLNPAALLTRYRVDAGTWTPIGMSVTGNPNEYAASIPGQPDGSDVDYYISAGDSSGATALDPPGAPASFHSFSIGADTDPPVITHTPITDWPLIQWPAEARALVTDNLGVASVVVEWTRNASPEIPFALVREGSSDTFSADFPVGAPPVAIGDHVCYRIRATDSSSNSNEALAPPSGDYCFDVIDVLGTVLVIDDWDGAKSGPETKIVEGKGGNIVESAVAKAASASRIARWLREAGYSVTEETSGATNAATWPSYSFILSSSGDDTSPVSNATYRGNLESFAAGGGKILVEGGEVGYDAISYPGYPTFASGVLHISAWQSDNAGNLSIKAGQECHPLVTTPHALPATIGITYGSYGDEDACTPASGATVILETVSKPGAGGVHIYDNNAAPGSAQIVDFNFSIEAVTDSVQAKHLVANAAAFLAANEGAASGSISGRVDLLGTSDDSGVIVTAGGRADTTDVAGLYMITGLYRAPYTVTATKAGYATGAATCVPVLEAQNTPDIDFSLSPVIQVSYCVSPALAIPDNNTTGVTSTITVPDDAVIMDVKASVNITHTYKGDLEVTLTSPEATAVILHNRTGGSADNIITTFDVPTAVDGPGAMNDFDGEGAAGGWKLKVRDLASTDIGTLNQWCVILTLQQQVGVEETSGGVPVATVLHAPRPNPFNPLTVLSYDLAVGGHATLAVYDAGGRLVRTLHSGVLPAGHYEAVWDGRADGGARVSSGVYFARLQADRRTYGSKMVVLK
jgi:subtilisin-like proprotein convertase family protein